MSEVQSSVEFEHFHRDGIKDLDLERGRLADARERHYLSSLDDELEATLRSVAEKLSPIQGGAEDVFKKAMDSLDEVERRRFIIENALESLKNGRDIAATLNMYQQIGLVQPPDPARVHPQIAPPMPFASTMALLERKSIWKRVATTLMQVGVNAVKTVPRWIEIEPHVGFVGPFPSISFTLKGKGMTVYEFLG